VPNRRNSVLVSSLWAEAFLRVTTRPGNGAEGIGRFEPEHLLAEARVGRRESLGRALELNRTYLTLLARTQIDLHVQGRVDASDVVQETFLDACRDLDHFRGSSPGEWVAWLR
jgi:hypothetical protein